MKESTFTKTDEHGEKLKERLIESTFAKADERFEEPLRPEKLDDFIGQEEVKERLKVVIGAAKKRGEALGHCMFSGPPGLGKTTLATIVAKEMGKSLVCTSGPALEKAADLAGILTSLQVGEVLFIDEIHSIPRPVEEYLYQAMEDFKLDIMIDAGPHARSVSVKLNPFTLVGATTRFGLITAPMRSRFSFHTRMDYYLAPALHKILERSSRVLKVAVDSEGLMEIALRARGTPRIANNLLRFVRDFASMSEIQGEITKVTVDAALSMLAIDKRGLDEVDKKILTLIIDHFDGGPVGLSTLAIAVGEEAHTIEEVYEPFLILQGFLKRTPRGRVATELAYAHLNYKE